MSDLYETPKKCECIVCGAVFYKYSRSQVRRTCSRECSKKYQGSQISKGWKGENNSACMTPTEKETLDKIVKPKVKVKNCQFCPLKLTYEKDRAGNYICGNMELENFGMGAMWIKRPDRRCRANG